MAGSAVSGFETESELEVLFDDAAVRPQPGWRTRLRSHSNSSVLTAPGPRALALSNACALCRTPGWSTAVVEAFSMQQRG